MLEVVPTKTPLSLFRPSLSIGTPKDLFVTRAFGKATFTVTVLIANALTMIPEARPRRQMPRLGVLHVLTR